MKLTAGVQQYMFRDHFKSEAQAVETMKRIKAIGYDAIELCGFLMEPTELTKGTPLEVNTHFDYPALVKEAGIQVCSLHEVFEVMLNDPDAYIKKADKFGIKNMVAAATISTDFRELSSVKRFTDGLNRLGKAFGDAGVALVYHNHNMEFARVPGTQKTGMDFILEDTDPAYVKAELDTFWTTNSGANPLSWTERFAGRLTHLHLNDCGVPDDGPGVSIRTAVGKELGTGNMELEKIIQAAGKAGCRTIILETHDNWIGNDPFKSCRVSYDYLSTIL